MFSTRVFLPLAVLGGLRCYFWGLSTKAARKPKKCGSTARKIPTVLSRKNVKFRCFGLVMEKSLGQLLWLGGSML
jgi:hypothetical protein